MANNDVNGLDLEKIDTEIKNKRHSINVPSFNPDAELIARKSNRNITDALQAEPVSLIFKDLCYSIRQKGSGKGKNSERKLLQNISGVVNPGEMLVVMGPSGAGKTTLLDILSCRKAPSKGIVRYGNETRLPADRICYIQQEDVFLPTATVREALQLSAKLRLPSSTPKHQLDKLVTSALEELGLTQCADTRIGEDGDSHRISGGERKRLAIGIDLILRPSVLFLDEPTTGLDSATALQVVEALEFLKRGRTIVCTLHQPRYDILLKFEKLLILSEGGMAYFGPPAGAVDFLQELHFECPPFINPTDFIIDTVKEDGDGQRMLPRKFLELRQLPPTLANVDKGTLVVRPHSNPLDVLRYITQFWELLVRGLKHRIRSPWDLAALAILYVVSGLLYGLMYLSLDKKSSKVFDWITVIFWIVYSVQFVPIYASLPVFPHLRRVFNRERSQHFYSSSSWTLATFATEVVLTAPLVALYCLLTYWMIDFRHQASSFFYFLALNEIAAINAILLTLVCCGFSSSVEMANNIIIIPLNLILVFSGLLLLPPSIPKWFYWAHYGSYVRYAVDGLVKNQFKNLALRCDQPDPCILGPTASINSTLTVPSSWLKVDNASLACSPSGCRFPNGRTVIDYVGFKPASLSTGENLLISLTFTIGLIVIACLVYRFVRLGRA